MSDFYDSIFWNSNLAILKYSNNRRKLEKRINFYRIQNIWNHFHRGNSGNRRESNNTPVHKKNNSISEPIKKGVAPVPSSAVREQESSDAKQSKFNTTRRFKTNRKGDFLNKEKVDFDLSQNKYDSMMNSNRLIEPFSPTFEHPDDFLPSNQTSFRPHVGMSNIK